MNEIREQGRAIMIVIAIITLLFINIGIFYTSYITKLSNRALSEPINSVSTTKLDQTGLDKLKDRRGIDVEAKLRPYQSGRANPFSP